MLTHSSRCLPPSTNAGHLLLQCAASISLELLSVSWEGCHYLKAPRARSRESAMNHGSHSCVFLCPCDLRRSALLL